MSMTRRTWLGLLASVAAVTIASAPAVAQQQRKPNIVFMLTDNLGYGELGVYGGGILRGAPTPSIDALAAQGMRLLNFNVEAQCHARPLHAASEPVIKTPRRDRFGQ